LLLQLPCQQDKPSLQLRRQHYSQVQKGLLLYCGQISRRSSCHRTLLW
jgi:hypothetical protein